MAHLVVFGDFICDLLDRKILVLWNLTVAHVLAHNPLFLAGDDVLQEVDGHLLCVKYK